MKPSRKELNRAIRSQDASLERAYRRVGNRVRRALRRNPSLNVERLIRRELRNSFARRLSTMTEAIGEMAGMGAAAHVAEVRSVLGRSAATRLANSAFHSPAAAIMRGELTPGGVSLRLRLSNIDASIAETLGQAASAARTAGESAVSAANRFMQTAGAQLETDLPAYVAELQDAIAHGDVEELRSAVGVFERATMRQGSVAGSQFTIRGANRRLLRGLRRANVADQQRLIDDYIQRRALQRARTIARTEGVRSFNAAYVRRAGNNPDVEAFQYNLSGSHPEPDVCDLLASQGPDGLGEGVYRKGKEPSLPAHPHCLCFFTSVLVKPDGSTSLQAQEPVTAEGWLANQSESSRRSILGPTRASIFRRNPSAVVTSRGGIRLVRTAQRRAT